MSNQVSWQSAFWALVPIALNSMSQPSGKVLGFPPKYGFFLNSSPIVCVANALELVFKLSWRSWSMRSLDEAFDSVADELFGNDESPEHPDTITQLQEMKAVRLIVFSFGALPQVVKLCAMRGIVRTQICALLFLGSFMVIEAIMLGLKKYRAAGRDRQTVLETPNENNKLNMIRGLLICASHSSAIYLVATTFAGLTRLEIIHLIAVLTGTLYASITDTLYIFLSKALHKVLAAQRLEAFDSLIPSRPRSDYQGMPLRSLIWVFMEVCAQVLGVTALLVNSDYYAEAAGIFIVNLHSGFLMGGIHKPVRTAGEKYSVNLSPHGFVVYMLLHLLAAVKTYAFSYDPTNTYKPGWTNKLG
ncbi:hypothetical protein G7Y79_00007g021410 [Physcia stellaris]|nr:hypothetical protein G7Y79_00007g021410 [Physcia stellaris]